MGKLMGLAVSLSALLLSTLLARTDTSRTQSHHARPERGGAHESIVVHRPVTAAVDQYPWLALIRVAALSDDLHGVNAVPDLGKLELHPGIWSWLIVDPRIGIALPERELYGSATPTQRTPGVGLMLGDIKISGSAQYNFTSRALSMGATVSVDI